MLATAWGSWRGDKLTVDSNHQLVLVGRSDRADRYSRSIYSLAVQSGHQVLISMWLQARGKKQ